MNPSRSLLRPAVALALGCSLLFAGCTSTKAIPLPDTTGHPVVAVRPGDKVLVQTRRGESLAFTVTAVEPDGLVSGTYRLKYQELAKLSVQRPDPVKTAGAVLIGVVAIFGLSSLVSDAGAAAVFWGSN